MVKRGDKVIFINDKMLGESLTIGKEYIIRDIRITNSIIVYGLDNDYGYYFLYNSNMFMSLEEYRNSVINNILE